MPESSQLQLSLGERGNFHYTAGEQSRGYIFPSATESNVLDTSKSLGAGILEQIPRFLF